MTYEGLAHRMTLAGCSIQGSALYKIEKAGRRITVDELVALAQVFDAEVEDLLTPLELVLHADIEAQASKLDRLWESLYWQSHAVISAEAEWRRMRHRAEEGDDPALADAFAAWDNELEAREAEAMAGQPAEVSRPSDAFLGRHRAYYLLRRALIEEADSLWRSAVEEDTGAAEADNYWRGPVEGGTDG